MDKKHLDVATKRYAGILLHPTSFPNPYGIGDLGKGAFDFIDFMEKAGMTAWQVLPLGHTGFGDSPYQPFSSFAGQPLIISIDHLIELDLLDEDDLKDMPQWNPEDISYGDVIAFKTELYRTAYERFIDKEFTDKLSTDEELMADYNKFINESDWLKDYALFMAGKDYHKGAPWYMWDESLKNPKDSERAEWEEKLSKEIGYYEFLQYLFYTEWTKLKELSSELPEVVTIDGQEWTLIDSIDVLNKDSEQAHAFQILEARDSWRARQRIRYPDGVTVEDVGIAHEGGYTSFEIHNVTPNRPIMLLRRMDYARGDFEIEYSANETRIGISQCAGSDKRFRWRNWPFLIPAEFVTTEVLKVTQKAVTAARDINMYHFWFYQAL